MLDAFNAIFITEVSGFYLHILGKAGGAPSQPAAIKALCWGLVTKLLWVIFKEVHKVRANAAGLENIQDNPGKSERVVVPLRRSGGAPGAPGVPQVRVQATPQVSPACGDAFVQYCSPPGGVRSMNRWGGSQPSPVQQD